MARRILIVQGHPDGANPHFCHALAEAYADGARAAGHEVARIDTGTLDIPTMRSRAEWQGPSPHAFVAAAQEEILNAEHLVLIYPLWMGTVPAHLKAFIEHVFSEKFAFDIGGAGWTAKLKGRSAHVVVTMGMPAVAYRYWFLAHSLRSLRRNVLGFVGFRPIRDSLIGMVEDKDPSGRLRWLERMRAAGRAAR